MKDLRIENYVEYLLSEGKDYNKTIKKYISSINEFIEYTRVETIEDIDNLTWIDIKMKWINIKKNEGLSAQSINIRITAIRSYFNFLVGSRLIRENVAMNIKKERTQPRKATIDEEKIKEMLKIADDEFENNPTFLTCRNRFMLYFALFTGVRNSEMRNIKISDISLSGEFEVCGKYSKVRKVVLAKQLIPMMQQYITMFRSKVDAKEDWLFVSNHGLQLDKNSPNRIVKTFAKQVGLEEWVFHCTRKATITTLINSGVAIEQVSKIVGHVSSKTTLSSYYQPNVDTISTAVNSNKLLEII